MMEHIRYYDFRLSLNIPELRKYPLKKVYFFGNLINEKNINFVGQDPNPDL